MNGVTLAGSATISATATDNVGVNKVEFYRGTTLIGIDTNLPYSFNWDTTQTANGAHTLTAKAYDAAGNSGTSSAINVNVDNPVASYTLTVTKSGTGIGIVTSLPSGINCGSDCSENYVSGAIVTLTPTANTGSVFAGWGGACSGTGTCTITMDAAKTVTAIFSNTQTAPLAPINLIGTAVSSSKIRLTWSDMSMNEDGFVIERGKTKVRGTVTDWQQVGTTGADTNTFNDQELQAKTNYYYRVYAFNTYGN